MLKKTNLEIKEFNSASNIFLKGYDTIKERTPEDVRLKYALIKVRKQTLELEENIDEEIEKSALDLCVKNDKNVIEYTEKGDYVFDKDNQINFKKKVKEIHKKSEEVKPHYVEKPEKIGSMFSELTNTLGMQLNLNGFVFKVLTEEEELKALELETPSKK